MAMFLFFAECAACAAVTSVYAWIYRPHHSINDARAMILRFAGPLVFLIFALSMLGEITHPQRTPADFSVWWIIGPVIWFLAFAILIVIERRRPPERSRVTRNSRGML